MPVGTTSVLSGMDALPELPTEFPEDALDALDAVAEVMHAVSHHNGALSYDADALEEHHLQHNRYSLDDEDDVDLSYDDIHLMAVPTGSAGSHPYAERIVAKRKRKSDTQYLLKWSGRPHAQNTWESSAAVRSVAPDLLEQFEAQEDLRRSSGATSAAASSSSAAGRKAAGAGNSGKAAARRPAGAAVTGAAGGAGASGSSRKQQSQNAAGDPLDPNAQVVRKPRRARLAVKSLPPGDRICSNCGLTGEHVRWVSGPNKELLCCACGKYHVRNGHPRPRALIERYYKQRGLAPPAMPPAPTLLAIAGSGSSSNAAAAAAAAAAATAAHAVAAGAAAASAAQQAQAQAGGAATSAGRAGAGSGSKRNGAAAASRKRRTGATPSQQGSGATSATASVASRKAAAATSPKSQARRPARALTPVPIIPGLAQSMHLSDDDDDDDDGSIDLAALRRMTGSDDEDDEGLGHGNGHAAGRDDDDDDDASDDASDDSLLHSEDDHGSHGFPLQHASPARRSAVSPARSTASSSQQSAHLASASKPTAAELLARAAATPTRIVHDEDDDSVIDVEGNSSDDDMTSPVAALRMSLVNNTPAAAAAPGSAAAAVAAMINPAAAGKLHGRSTGASSSSLASAATTAGARAGAPATANKAGAPGARGKARRSGGAAIVPAARDIVDEDERAAQRSSDDEDDEDDRESDDDVDVDNLFEFSAHSMFTTAPAPLRIPARDEEYDEDDFVPPSPDHCFSDPDPSVGPRRLDFGTRSFNPQVSAVSGSGPGSSGSGEEEDLLDSADLHQVLLNHLRERADSSNADATEAQMLLATLGANSTPQHPVNPWRHPTTPTAGDITPTAGMTSQFSRLCSVSDINPVARSLSISAFSGNVSIDEPSIIADTAAPELHPLSRAPSPPTVSVEYRDQRHTLMSSASTTFQQLLRQCCEHWSLDPRQHTLINDDGETWPAKSSVQQCLAQYGSSVIRVESRENRAALASAKQMSASGNGSQDNGVPSASRPASPLGSSVPSPIDESRSSMPTSPSRKVSRSEFDAGINARASGNTNKRARTLAEPVVVPGN